MLSSHDIAALENLKNWEEEFVYKNDNSILKQGLGRAGKVVKPIADPLTEKLKNLTNYEVVTRIQTAIQDAIAGAFQFTHDTVKYTYNRESILKALEIDSFDDLNKFDADEVEKHVRKTANTNKLAAALEGVGFGMGGLEATLIEIPIFFCLIARVQQQICACYGYDPESEFEQSYMTKALSFSDFMTVGGKAELILEMNALKVAIKRHTYKELKELGGKYLIPEIAKKFAKEQGKSLSKKKMAQALPVIGSIVGGMFNYGYIQRIISVTNKLYKRRFIEDKIAESDIIVDIECAVCEDV